MKQKLKIMANPAPAGGTCGRIPPMEGRLYRHTGIIWIIFLLLASPAICIAQDGIYKIIDPHLKGDIEVGCIVGTDKKGEIKDVLIPRSAVVGYLRDASILEKKPMEHLPTYSRQGSGSRRGGSAKIPHIVSLVLERFDIMNDSINLLALRKESLLNGKYAASLLKKDREAMNRIKDVIERDIDSYDRISLVASLVYADSGIIQTDRKKGKKLEAKGEWTTLVDSAKTAPSISFTDTAKSGQITMKLIYNSPVLYSGKAVFASGYNYKAIIPFGIDNFCNRQYAKGLSCFLLETAGIGGFFYFKSEQDNYKKHAKSSLNEDKVREYNRKAGNMEKAKWASIAGAGLVYVVWDFLFDFSPLERNQSSRYHAGNFKVMPYSTIQDSGLALSFNF
jgi:hypothetical protein